MPKFYPSFDFEKPDVTEQSGDHAEHEVLDVLGNLSEDWHIFHGFEWREIDLKRGERRGEGDVIVFHPKYGILVIEIKSGGVALKNGEWFYVDLFDRSEKPMKMSPFTQASRTMYYIKRKLQNTPISYFLKSTALTYTAWFPYFQWTGDIPPEVPSGSFILDMMHLKNPDKHLRNILVQSSHNSEVWNDKQIKHLMQTLAPEVNLLPTMGKVIGQIKSDLYRMTEGQIRTLRALRTQDRLLVEGCAGSGKTLIAMSLAREHLQDGRRVLFTCFNKFLAKRISFEMQGYENLDAINFHDLVEKLCNIHKIPYILPTTSEGMEKFFNEDCAELLLDASQAVTDKYDTIIVDEAIDFRETWWVPLESLAQEEFSFFVFYDRNQRVYREIEEWSPPFKLNPIPLDINVRNTKPIGEYACKIGKIKDNIDYGIEDGPKPKIISYKKSDELPDIIKKLIKQLIKKEKIPAQDIVILSPYRYTNKRLGIENFLDKNGDLFSTDMTDDSTGKVRIGTIQAYKGLEADVVILLGIDGHMPACKPANLYVGASRARTMLYVIKHEEFKI